MLKNVIIVIIIIIIIIIIIVILTCHALVSINKHVKYKRGIVLPVTRLTVTTEWMRFEVRKKCSDAAGVTYRQWKSVPNC